MKPKNTGFFNQRREDENQNKYQMLAFTCVDRTATEGNSVGLAIKVNTSLIRIFTTISREVKIF